MPVSHPHSRFRPSVAVVLPLLALVAVCTPSLFASPDAGPEQAASTSADWPGYRGPGGDAHGAAGALGAWPATPALEVVWKRPLGPSYSTIAAADGRGFTGVAAGEHDWLTAFHVATGDELWRLSLGPRYTGHDGSHDGPIATPAVADGRVFALGAHGRLVAASRDGEELWRKELSELGADPPWYGYSSSPLVVDDVVVVQATSPDGGPAIHGFDVATGEVRWTAGEGTVDYQSPVLVPMAGEEQLVAVDETRIFGLDPATGQELWRTEHGGTRHPMGAGSAMAVPLGDGRFLVKATHTELHAYAPTVADVETDGEAAAGAGVDVAWSNKDVARTYAPPVHHDGVVYAYKGGFLSAVDGVTGETLWRSRPPGDGFLAVADGHLVVLTKKGMLHLAAASREEWTPSAELQLFEDASWSEPTLAGGLILARSMGELAAVRIVDGAVADAVEWPGTDLPAGEFASFLAGLKTAEDRSAAIDGFLAEHPEMPLIEGDQVYWLYRGDVESVGLQGDMTGDRTEAQMTAVPGTDLFFYSRRLPRDAWISYRLAPGFADMAPDPRNPRTVPSIGQGGDEILKSWFAMPEWPRPAYMDASMDDAALRGRMVSHQIPIPSPEPEEGAEGGSDEGETSDESAKPTEPEEPQTRTVRVYLPPGYDEAPEVEFPVVFVAQGQFALDWGHLDRVVDHLIGHTLPPAVVVFVDPFGPGMADAFGGHPAHADHFFGHVVPFVDATYRVADGPAGRGYLGAGMGGTVAWADALDPRSRAGRVALIQPFFIDMGRKGLHAAAQELAPEVRPRLYVETSHYGLRAEHEGWNGDRIVSHLLDDLRAEDWQVEQVRTNDGAEWGAYRARVGAALAVLLAGDR